MRTLWCNTESVITMDFMQGEHPIRQYWVIRVTFTMGENLLVFQIASCFILSVVSVFLKIDTVCRMPKRQFVPSFVAGISSDWSHFLPSWMQEMLRRTSSGKGSAAYKILSAFLLGPFLILTFMLTMVASYKIAFLERRSCNSWMDSEKT